VFMIGIHAAAGTEGAVLDHTWIPKCVQSLRVNGVIIGELGLNALLAGHMNVPISLVTGDQAVAKEAVDLLGEVECAVVKTGLNRYSARSPHPSISRLAIEQAAERAVRQAGRFKPLKMKQPLRMEIDYTNSAFASFAAWIPTAEKVGPRTVAFTIPDFEIGYKTFLVAAALPYRYDDPIY